MPVKAKPKLPTYSPNDRYIMAATIWAEARGEGWAGMNAVAHVIMNRMHDKSSLFAATIPGVALQRGQFTCWEHGHKHLAKSKLDDLDPIDKDGYAWTIAQEIADEVLAGEAHDPTRGALYYNTGHTAPDGAGAEVVKLGHHRFYL